MKYIHVHVRTAIQTFIENSTWFNRTYEIMYNTYIYTYTYMYIRKENSQPTP